MPTNPFAHQCRVPGCSQRVTARGRCAAHAGQVDALRGLSSDRQHKHLYDSARWKRLRAHILTTRIWCECQDCTRESVHRIAEVVHHVTPHGGDETLFFAEANLQPLAKQCHDQLTGRSRTSGGRSDVAGRDVVPSAGPCGARNSEFP